MTHLPGTLRAYALVLPLALALAHCAAPDVAVPDVAAPDVALPDVALPDVALPDVAAPDVASLDASLDALAQDASRDVAPDRALDVAVDRPRDASADAGRRAVTVSAYYAAWMQDAVPPSAVDFASVTQVHHFSLVPRADGTLDADENGLTTPRVRALVAAAHAARRLALVSVGGADTVEGFRGAWSDGRRAAFVGRLVRFVTDHGYDGLDVDVEPLTDTDAAAFQRFVRALRAALDAARPGLLLTAAAAGAPSAYGPVQALFDQVNVMTYDLSGPWPGWVTWHNSPLHDGGARFPSTGAALPSADAMLARFMAAGVDRARLGIGIDFYGYEWRGATAPRQPVAGVTMRTLSYAQIMDSLWRADRARWDAGAMVPWLSVDAPGTADDRFVSYDDERSAAAKVDYVRARGHGAVIVWELGGGWRASQPAGSRDLLLRAVGRAARGG